MQKKSLSCAWTVHPEMRLCPERWLRKVIQTRKCPGSHVLLCPDNINYPGSRWQSDSEIEFWPGSRETQRVFLNETMQTPAARVKILSLKPETTFNSDASKIANHFFTSGMELVDREMHQDPERDRYTVDEEGTVIYPYADELELIAL